MDPEIRELLERCGTYPTVEVALVALIPGAFSTDPKVREFFERSRHPASEASVVEAHFLSDVRVAVRADSLSRSDEAGDRRSSQCLSCKSSASVCLSAWM